MTNFVKQYMYSKADTVPPPPPTHTQPKKKKHFNGIKRRLADNTKQCDNGKIISSKFSPENEDSNVDKSPSVKQKVHAVNTKATALIRLAKCNIFGDALLNCLSKIKHLLLIQAQSRYQFKDCSNMGCWFSQQKLTSNM